MAISLAEKRIIHHQRLYLTTEALKRSGFNPQPPKPGWRNLPTEELESIEQQEQKVLPMMEAFLKEFEQSGQQERLERESQLRCQWRTSNRYAGVWRGLRNGDGSPFGYGMCNCGSDIALVLETCARIMPLLLDGFKEYVDIIAAIQAQSADDSEFYYDMIDEFFWQKVGVPEKSFRELDQVTWAERNRHPKYILNEDGRGVLVTQRTTPALGDAHG